MTEAGTGIIVETIYKERGFILEKHTRHYDMYGKITEEPYSVLYQVRCKGCGQLLLDGHHMMCGTPHHSPSKTLLKMGNALQFLEKL